MSQLTYDPSFVNTAYTVNKLFTNSVQLDCRYPISSLTKVINNTTDTFGGTKKVTNYVIAPRAIPELEAFSRALILSLGKTIPGKFEFHLLSKRAEFWQPKDREEDVDFFNAVRFTISINHETGKVWITPILTVHLGDDDIDREDEDGNSTREYPDQLVKVKASASKPAAVAPAAEPLLVPRTLRRNRAIAPTEDEIE